MDHCKANESIRCSDVQSKNHCDTKDYCALESITVGTHEANPTVCQCTDCESFQPKQCR